MASFRSHKIYEDFGKNNLISNQTTAWLGIDCDSKIFHSHKYNGRFVSQAYMKQRKTIFRPDLGPLSGGGRLSLVPRSRNGGVVSSLPHTSSQLTVTLYWTPNGTNFPTLVTSLASYFPYLEQMKFGLCNLHAVCVSPRSQIFMNLYEILYVYHCT